MARKKQDDLMAQAVALFHAKKMDWMKTKKTRKIKAVSELKIWT